MLDHISKHFEVRRIFKSFLGVCKCGQTRYFKFDTLLTTLVGVFVVEKFFCLVPISPANITLVRIFIKVFHTKIMNFAAADEKGQINNEREKGTRG